MANRILLPSVRFARNDFASALEYPVMKLPGILPSFYKGVILQGGLFSKAKANVAVRTVRERFWPGEQKEVLERGYDMPFDDIKAGAIDSYLSLAKYWSSDEEEPVLNVGITDDLAELLSWAKLQNKEMGLKVKLEVEDIDVTPLTDSVSLSPSFGGGEAKPSFGAMARALKDLWVKGEENLDHVVPFFLRVREVIKVEHFDSAKEIMVCEKQTPEEPKIDGIPALITMTEISETRSHPHQAIAKCPWGLAGPMNIPMVDIPWQYNDVHVLRFIAPKNPKGTSVPGPTPTSFSSTFDQFRLCNVNEILATGF